MPCKEDLDGTSVALWADLPDRLERAGVPTLDAGRELRKPERPEIAAGLFYRHDIHLTPAGNRWVASRVENFLLERGLLARAPLPLAAPGAAAGAVP